MEGNVLTSEPANDNAVRIEVSKELSEFSQSDSDLHTNMMEGDSRENEEHVKDPDSGRGQVKTENKSDGHTNNTNQVEPKLALNNQEIGNNKFMQSSATDLQNKTHVQPASEVQRVEKVTSVQESDIEGNLSDVKQFRNTELLSENTLHKHDEDESMGEWELIEWPMVKDSSNYEDKQMRVHTQNNDDLSFMRNISTRFPNPNSNVLNAPRPSSSRVQLSVVHTPGLSYVDYENIPSCSNDFTFSIPISVEGYDEKCKPSKKKWKLRLAAPVRKRKMKPKSSARGLSNKDQKLPPNANDDNFVDSVVETHANNPVGDTQVRQIKGKVVGSRDVNSDRLVGDSYKQPLSSTKTGSRDCKQSISSTKTEACDSRQKSLKHAQKDSVKHAQKDSNPERNSDVSSVINSGESGDLRLQPGCHTLHSNEGEGLGERDLKITRPTSVQKAFAEQVEMIEQEYVQEAGDTNIPLTKSPDRVDDVKSPSSKKTRQHPKRRRCSTGGGRKTKIKNLPLSDTDNIDAPKTSKVGQYLLSSANTALKDEEMPGLKKSDTSKDLDLNVRSKQKDSNTRSVVNIKSARHNDSGVEIAGNEDIESVRSGANTESARSEDNADSLVNKDNIKNAMSEDSGESAKNEISPKTIARKIMNEDITESARIRDNTESAWTVDNSENVRSEGNTGRGSEKCEYNTESTVIGAKIENARTEDSNERTRNEDNGKSARSEDTKSAKNDGTENEDDTENVCSGDITRNARSEDCTIKKTKSTKREDCNTKKRSAKSEDCDQVTINEDTRKLASKCSDLFVEESPCERNRENFRNLESRQAKPRTRSCKKQSPKTLAKEIHKASQVLPMKQDKSCEDDKEGARNEDNAECARSEYNTENVGSEDITAKRTRSVKSEDYNNRIATNEDTRKLTNTYLDLLDERSQRKRNREDSRNLEGRKVRQRTRSSKKQTPKTLAKETHETSQTSPMKQDKACEDNQKSTRTEDNAGRARREYNTENAESEDNTTKRTSSAKSEDCNQVAANEDTRELTNTYSDLLDKESPRKRNREDYWNLEGQKVRQRTRSSKKQSPKTLAKETHEISQTSPMKQDQSCEDTKESTRNGVIVIESARSEDNTDNSGSADNATKRVISAKSEDSFQVAANEDSHKLTNTYSDLLDERSPRKRNRRSSTKKPFPRTLDKEEPHDTSRTSPMKKETEKESPKNKRCQSGTRKHAAVGRTSYTTRSTTQKTRRK